MGLNRYKLGNLIQELRRFNSDKCYGLEYVRGVSNTKEIMTTKADVDENVISKFYVIEPGEFIYNPRTTRMGEKVGLAYNNTEKPLLFTFNNIAFAIKESAKNVILADYLYIYFNRSEFDRYARINSWGSATELFTFDEMCDIDIALPPLEIQQKYVNIYNAMVANQKAYETGLEDLKLVCDGILDKVKKNAPHIPMKNVFEAVDVRNSDMTITSISGININKSFMPSVANVDDGSLKNYKIVKTNQFAFSGMQTGRDKCIRIALNQQIDNMIISPAYTVFWINNSSVLEEYVMLWFSRSETDRLGWFVSDSSIRSNLDLDRFFEIKIPIPDIKVQKSIANIYKVYKERQTINEQLKAQIKNICSILIKDSLEEAQKEK